jgi:hypothetical protein
MQSPFSFGGEDLQFLQLSKSKKRTGRALIGARVAPSSGISLLKPPPHKKEETQRLVTGGGPRPWMDALPSHKVTKVHTISFLAIPVILRIVAQISPKQEKHASFPLYASSPHFLVLSDSAKGKSHFKGLEKSVHVLALCDHN